MRAGREVRARRFEHQHHQNIIIPTPTISLTNQRNHLHHQRRQRRTKSVDNNRNVSSCLTLPKGLSR